MLPGRFIQGPFPTQFGVQCTKHRAAHALPAGITSSQGITYDFAGFGVSRGHFAFGQPTRYIPLAPSAARGLDPGGDKAAAWDHALSCAAQEYDNEVYTLFGSNCHTFVQHFLHQVDMPSALGWSPLYLVRIRRFVFALHCSMGSKSAVAHSTLQSHASCPVVCNRLCCAPSKFASCHGSLHLDVLMCVNIERMHLEGMRARCAAAQRHALPACRVASLLRTQGVDCAGGTALAAPCPQCS